MVFVEPMENDTHEHDTFQPIGLAAERVVELTRPHDHADADHRNEEHKSEKDADKNAAAEFESIQSRLRFLNMIELALQNRARRKRDEI